MTKEYMITIDGGTTNTRALLWKGEEPVAAAAREVGVRNNAIADSVSPLREAVKACLEQLRKEAGISYDEVEAVVASGMLTSNVGLVEIPHLTAPVTAEMLARNIKQVLLEDICPLPISFIPGVKNKVPSVTMDNFDRMDMMRGEEVETFAVLRDCSMEGPAVLILPGSHTKFVAVDASGAITGCLTTINGELLSAITKNTILANSVGQKFVSAEAYDGDMVKRGARAAAKDGLGRACFSGRILNTFVTDDQMKVANFLLGAVLQGDVEALTGSSALSVTPDTQIIIAGKNPLRQALKDVLEDGGSFRKITVYEPDKNRPMSGIGARYLYRLAQEAEHQGRI